MLFRLPGIVDQIGGGILALPPPLEHIPAINGSIINIPSGLQVSPGRAFEWKIVIPVTDIVSFTGQFTATPTIEVSENFSSGVILLSVELLGQPSSRVFYSIGTSLSSNPALIDAVVNEEFSTEEGYEVTIFPDNIGYGQAGFATSSATANFSYASDILDGYLILEKYSPGVGWVTQNQSNITYGLLYGRTAINLDQPNITFRLSYDNNQYIRNHNFGFKYLNFSDEIFYAKDSPVLINKSESTIEGGTNLTENRSFYFIISEDSYIDQNVPIIQTSESVYNDIPAPELRNFFIQIVELSDDVEGVSIIQTVESDYNNNIVVIESRPFWLEEQGV